MKVYVLGSHGQSNTNGKVLISVELTPNTDMRGITIYNGKHITNPFYRELKLNAGKITRITDLEEEYDFTAATIQLDGQSYQVDLGKYFYLADTDGKEIDRSDYITAYQYKSAVLEISEYIARGYTGVAYTHYPSGKIKIKAYYKKGNIHSRFYYRDDTFNTLEGVRQYHKDKVECEYTYDTREALTKQLWYNSKGRVYSKKISHVVPQDTVAVAPHERHPSIKEEEEGETEDPNDSGSDSEGDEEEDTIIKSPVSNLGHDAGGFRFKPKDEDDSEEVSESSA